MSTPSFSPPLPDRPPLRGRRLFGHFLILFLVAVAVWLQFLRAPGFGDDLTYWSQAFDIHERGLVALNVKSFHDLRWPVWGLCWALQSVLGFGLASYYLPPLIFLFVGAVLAFVFVEKSARSTPIAWAAGIGFLFHPLLDTVCYRPMPDAAEGMWSGLVLLAWWALMETRRRGLQVLLAALVGLGVFIIQANRITGVFIVPVLIVATLLLFPRKFGWLVFAGAFAALFFGLEAYFYHEVFGDWLHALHANMGAKGRKGTESMPLWWLPLRFFDTLWGGIGPIYCFLGALGLYAGWRRHGTGGRLMVIWFAVLYLSYSCAPQSLAPYRPLVRDADRFLSGLAIPISVLAAFGLGLLFQPAWLGRGKIGQWLTRHPIPLAALGFVLLSVFTTRERFTLDYVPEMRRYLASLPAGTKIYTHTSMRPIAYLVNARAAESFTWHTKNSILHYDPKHEALADECDQLWYARKLLWLNTRKQIDEEGTTHQPRLATYFEQPEIEWTTTRLLAKADTPDLIFYRRRQPGDPPPRILTAASPELQNLVPALPNHWDRQTGKTRYDLAWPIPADLRGQFARFEVEAFAGDVEAVTFRLRFNSTNSAAQTDFLLKPYLYTEAGKDFFALQIPADADRCDIRVNFSKSANRVSFTGFRAVIENSAGAR